jgi:hypothetical protein
VEFALGISAALIGAGGAFAGAWLSGRHERELEELRWRKTRSDEAADATAAAVVELTSHLASALHTIEWFTAAATLRVELFNEQRIIDYDNDMRAHLTGTVQGLVRVAHHDEPAFRTLERLTKSVWELDWQVATAAASYWSDPEETRAKIAAAFPSAGELVKALPHQIADVLPRAVPSGMNRPG